jgi:hypothetical protein
VEIWRIVATGLLAASGVLLVLIVMAKVRDRTGRSVDVAISGAVTFTALGVLGLLMLTVLPGVVTWVIVAVIAAAVSVMVLAS